MSNDAFFDRFFPADFWRSMDRSRFVTDEQSMFGDAHAFDWVIKTVRPDTVVELGAWKGHSANYMADLCKGLGLDTKIICVDTFLGGPEHWVLGDMLEQMRRRNGMPTILEAFLGNTVARGNEGRIFPLTVDTAGGWQIMRDMGFTADLIFVDAGHSYEQAYGDIMGYWPRLSQRGVMFGDDYQAEDVANAVHDCAKKLDCQVAVISRKWVLVNENLLRYLSTPDVQLRTSREGWIHP
jgi:hypothetical protein